MELDLKTVQIIFITLGAVCIFGFGYATGGVCAILSQRKKRAKAEARHPLDEWREYSKKCVTAGKCPLCLSLLEDNKCTKCHWGEVSNFQ